MTRAMLMLSLVLMLASCGAPRPSRTIDPTALKTQIITLDNDIVSLRRDIGLSVSPPSAWIQWKGDPFARAAQPHGTCDKCVDACELADKICDNAEQICRIATELDGDDWARDKCSSAKGSCAEAKQHCDDCRCTADDAGSTHK